jgi:hypothetical protein
MTLRTLRRGSSKNALHVAPLAHDLCVAAAEREAGTAVIEFHVGTIRAILGLCLTWQHNGEPQGQGDEHRGPYAPLTQPTTRSVRAHRHSNASTFIRSPMALGLRDYRKWEFVPTFTLLR